MDLQGNLIEESVLAWGATSAINTVTQWMIVQLSNLVDDNRNRATLCILIVYSLHFVPLPPSATTRAKEQSSHIGCSQFTGMLTWAAVVVTMWAVRGNIALTLFVRFLGTVIKHALAVAPLDASAAVKRRLVARFSLASLITISYAVGTFALAYPDHETAHHLAIVVAPLRHLVRVVLHKLFLHKTHYNLFIAIAVDLPLFVCIYAFICDADQMRDVAVAVAVIDMVLTSGIVYSLSGYGDDTSKYMSYNWSFALWLQLNSVSMMGVVHFSARDVNVSCSNTPGISDVLERVFLVLVYLVIQVLGPAVLGFLIRLIFGTAEGNTPVKQRDAQYLAARPYHGPDIGQSYRFQTVVQYLPLLDTVSAEALAFYILFFEYWRDPNHGRL